MVKLDKSLASKHMSAVNVRHLRNLSADPLKKEEIGSAVPQPRGRTDRGHLFSAESKRHVKFGPGAGGDGEAGK